MSGEWKFRFLERTDSRRCRSLIRSCGERFLLFQKRYSLPDFVRGERSECHLPLTTHRIKQAWQWWGVARSDAFHLPDCR
uniref:GP05 n=1 Tax=Escherichia coli TaxID=562 RepID=A0A343W1K4_ECOLX|nr:GP05 [Escherichia coli]